MSSKKKSKSEQALADARGPFRVDTDAMMRIVDEAIEKDREYKLRNDAKFRAVAQKTATYDEFKGIVDLAHLQPLKKEDHIKPAKKIIVSEEPWTPDDNSAGDSPQTSNT